MISRPTSSESLRELRDLRNRAFRRGDESLAILVAGVDLYLSLGREYELLEVMQKFAEQMAGPVANTPTAAELERLFRHEPPSEQSEDPQ